MSTRRYWAVLLLAITATVGIFVASVLSGPTEIALTDLVQCVQRYDAGKDAHVAIRDVRLPRAVLILFVGAGLAAAGAVMQGVTRNPLAGPSIMGLSGGAALSSLVALIFWPGLGYTESIAASFVGAATGYGCVLTVTALSLGGLTPTRLALAGAVVSALFSAITQGLVIALAMASTMLYWTVGGVTNVTWEQVFAVVPCVAFGLVGVLRLAPDVTILSLGYEVAAGLGLRSGVVRVAATSLVLLLTGAAVAVAGPISFVGLMTPHACRLLAGADYRRLLPLTIVVGAGLTAAADLVARTALGMKGELPLGVITAVLGAPFFLWLLHSQRDRGLDGGQSQVRPRTSWSPGIALAGTAGLLVAVSVFAIQHGRADIAPADILRTLVGQGSSEHDLVLWSFRIPRLLFGILVGMGIAVSGTLMQAVLRNDLAEPGILGVSAGAGLAVVLLLAVVGSTALSSIILLPLASIAGALATTLIVYLLSSDVRLTPQRLLLTGITVNAAVSALTLLISLQISSDAYAFVVAFGSGSLNAADWNYVAMLAAVLAVQVPLAWSFAAMLNVLRLGESTATGLGVPLPWASLSLLALAVVICATCMALAGGVIFLGLVAPHIARRLVGADHTVVIPVAGLVGSTLLVLADVLGSSILPNTEIPAGVMVSALGAPYFLYLLTRS